MINTAAYQAYLNKLDLQYFEKLKEFFQTKYKGIIIIDKSVTKDYDKFVFHVKHYINWRRLQEPGDVAKFPDVEFNSQSETEIMYNAPYERFKVYGLPGEVAKIDGSILNSDLANRIINAPPPEAVKEKKKKVNKEIKKEDQPTLF